MFAVRARTVWWIINNRERACGECVACLRQLHNQTYTLRFRHDDDVGCLRGAFLRDRPKASSLCAAHKLPSAIVVYSVAKRRDVVARVCLVKGLGILMSCI